RRLRPRPDLLAPPLPHRPPRGPLPRRGPGAAQPDLLQRPPRSRPPAPRTRRHSASRTDALPVPDEAPRRCDGAQNDAVLEGLAVDDGLAVAVSRVARRQGLDEVVPLL